MRRTDLHKILIIGAGPIVIGQACEFDYSGTQACRALKEEGYEIVLVNSNPATIMTDPSTADHIYIEPLDVEVLTTIIDKERPDALLATLGGQTALNLATELSEQGILDCFNVELIGASVEVIERAESRETFKVIAQDIGLEVAKSFTVNTIEDAQRAVEILGFPCVIRPSYTLGGTGGGIAYNQQQFNKIAIQGLTDSLTTEILVEESLLGWKEYEMEVIRDKKDNVIIVCSMENVDPMGVHTGDSITIAPAQTLTNREFQKMRTASIEIIRAIGVETGGCNVQFAVNPENGRMIVIEVNPRVSRSSALASKATGYPIAKFAAKLAVGYTLDELENDITRKNACFEPSIDYCVVKIPRFNFNKFPEANDTLGTAMKAVGEIMAIGRTFKEALQKGMRSMELEVKTSPITSSLPPSKGKLGVGEFWEKIEEKLKDPNSERLWYIFEAFRQEMGLEEVYVLTRIDRWFLYQVKQLADVEISLKNFRQLIPDSSQEGNYAFEEEMIIGNVNSVLVETKNKTLVKTKDIGKNGVKFPFRENSLFEGGDVKEMAYTLPKLKQLGFSDFQIAKLLQTTEMKIRSLRKKQGILPTYKLVDTCAGEFEAYTPYYYSTYEEDDESVVTDKKKVMVIGSGPNRIGQGIEFDYCCVHAAMASKAAGYEVIMVNSNPETVSTDFDVSDKLYFEPITFEDVMNVYEKEQPEGIILQFGGQTPLNLASKLSAAGANVLGTSPKSIHRAEDRDEFQALCRELQIRQPENRIAYSFEEMKKAVAELGYPVIVRPSHVLGGARMKVIYQDEALQKYIQQQGTSYPILVESFLEDAVEIDVDALADDQDCVIAAIMEHVEPTGIHSGDSACVLPTYSISSTVFKQIETATKQLAKSLQIIGLMNIQFAVKNDELYIIEVNPRASRTVPFVSKATGIPWGKLATEVVLGKKVGEISLQMPPNPSGVGEFSEGKVPQQKWAVKEVVFPFNKFAGVDIALSPEMKSTGEVMGTDTDLGLAFFKAQLAADSRLPIEGKVFVDVPVHKRGATASMVEKLKVLGFEVLSSEETDLQAALDLVENGEIALLLQLPFDGESDLAVRLRRKALDARAAVVTTLRAMELSLKGIAAYQQQQRLEVTSL